jgi:hypothetical protein
VFGFGGDLGTQAIASGKVNRAPDPLLYRLLNVADSEDAANDRRIDFDHDIDITVRSVIAPCDRTEQSGMSYPHPGEVGLSMA